MNAEHQSQAAGDSSLAIGAPNGHAERVKAIHAAGPQRRLRFGFSLAAAAAVLLAAIWLSSGTMAIYGATLPGPRAEPPCDYLSNIDHAHFQATFWMLQGKPRATWEFSVVLRRILYPILAFPLMTALGFEIGGFATNVIITLLVFLAFVYFVRRIIGSQGALAAMWILATYPGIAYWVGLPYSYAFIVPGSLLLAMLLWKLGQTKGQVQTLLLSLAIGFLFWGYDLFPFFGTAALLILIRRRRFLLLPTAIVGMAIPTAILFAWLRFGFHTSMRNPNSESMFVVLKSFAPPIDYPGWWREISVLPSVFPDNYLYSNFLFLPLLFAALVLFGAIDQRSLRIDTPELEILLSALLVFLLNNLAPPYPGWQLRGVWIVRLYQPVFVAFVLFVSREVQRWWWKANRTSVTLGRAISAALVALAVLANGAVVFGPVLRLRLASEIYFHFYQHGTPDSLYVNLERYGHRPLGICKPRSGSP